MPHSLRYFPVALACSLAFNTHLISESHSAPRHQVPLSPAATPQPAPTHCAPAPFCRLFEPQSQYLHAQLGDTTPHQHFSTLFAVSSLIPHLR
jgi:hypothetical protein